MLSYFDSSVLLTIIFQEPRRAEAYSIWHTESFKVSSILLRIESLVSLRRMYEHNRKRLSPDWLKVKEHELDGYLAQANHRLIDDDLERLIRREKELSRCRTLDAIHIATALKYREAAGENLKLYSYDDSMREMAVRYGFDTFPGGIL